MPSMNAAPHRVVLLPEAKPVATHEPAAKVRRYRLARLRMAETREPRELRFAHIAAAHD